MSFSKGRFVATIHDLHTEIAIKNSDFAVARKAYEWNQWYLAIWSRRRTDLFVVDESIVNTILSDLNELKKFAIEELNRLFLEDLQTSQ